MSLAEFQGSLPRRFARFVIIQRGIPPWTAGVSPAELQMLGSLARWDLTISIKIWARLYVTNNMV